ncbi:hypothetical protein ACFSM5_14965 [Lacibacterium aquatile]|uniref:Uncharacterized protein n=1 Tax=Lacibacterium aquatile TaxID=1168082 RepID=A0ABW5DXM5_9PROT
MSDFIVNFCDQEFYRRIWLDYRNFQQPIAEEDLRPGLEVTACTPEGHRFAGIVDLARAPVDDRRWVIIDKLWLPPLSASPASQFMEDWDAGKLGFKIDYNDLWTPDIVYFSFHRNDQPLREEEMVAGSIVTACDSEGLSFQVTVRYFAEGHELWGGHWGGEFIDDTRRNMPGSLCDMTDNEPDWYKLFESWEAYDQAIRATRQPLAHASLNKDQIDTRH